MESNPGAIPYAVGLGILLVSVVCAVWLVVALGRVFSKFGEPAWKAWIPLLNIVTLLNLAGLNVAFIAIYLIPGVNSFSPIVTTLAAHHINIRFGKGTAYTVLAFLLFPVWATVLGFGSAVPIGGRPAPASASAAPWVPRTPSRFAPPVGYTRVPEITAIPPQLAVQQFQPPAVPADNSDFEKTVVSRRSTPTWTLHAEGGEAIQLAKPAALLGRNPNSSAEFADAQLVALSDPSKTVSKTHARLSLAGETWSIVDLESTNGVFLVSESDEEIELEPGVSADVGEAFRLGDLVLRISKGSLHKHGKVAR